MTVDGAEVGRGAGRDALGHPLNALSWLANHLISEGQILPAGAIVMTGSLIKTQWLSVGQSIRHQLASLGAVEAKIT